MKIEEFDEPTFEPEFHDIAEHASSLGNACLAVIAAEHHPDNSEFYDRAADQAELMVLALMRFWNNEKMMTLVTEELARAVKRGW